MISKQLPCLPVDIITNILTQFPVKTLTRFKCVSKFFLCLISSPQFIKTHLHISSKDPKFGHFMGIPCPSHTQLVLESCLLHPVLNAHHYDAITLDFPIKRTYPSVLIVGSVNGLLCIVINESHLVLWNPSTRVLRILPGMGLEIQKIRLTVYGFGFDEGTNDYKVVGIFCPHESGKRSMCNVYSLKADSWRIIIVFPCNIRTNESGKFTNGSLHWAMTQSVSPYLWTIFSFNLSNETYGEIEPPNYNVEGSRGAILGVLQGCLSVLVDFENVCTNVWVMKEYGVKDSWLKLYQIPYCGRPRVYVWYLFPLLNSSGGELLTEDLDSYFLYNPKQRTFNNIGVIKFGRLTNMFTFVESLVSPYTEAN